MPITCVIRYEIDPFQRDGFLTLREERHFVEVVEGTFGRPSTFAGPA